MRSSASENRRRLRGLTGHLDHAAQVERDTRFPGPLVAYRLHVLIVRLAVLLEQEGRAGASYWFPEDARSRWAADRAWMGKLLVVSKGSCRSRLHEGPVSWLGHPVLR